MLLMSIFIFLFVFESYKMKVYIKINKGNQKMVIISFNLKMRREIKLDVKEKCIWTNI